MGSGTVGLFASLVLAEFGVDATLIERGQPVKRGHITGFYFCFGEVMKTLVRFGTPESIFVDGKPHLGTDRLIPLLPFGTRVDDLIIENGHVVGVNVSDLSGSSQFNSEKLGFDAVVLAVGHSARGVYHTLLSHNVELVPKDFAVGLWVEHPQELINNIQVLQYKQEKEGETSLLDALRNGKSLRNSEIKLASWHPCLDYFGYTNFVAIALCQFEAVDV
ncbi:FAD/NAD(P)-binding oxidoreductase family protein [Tanacetum coccineum]